MRYLTQFKKDVIDELARQPVTVRIDLAKILQKKLPSEFYISNKGLISKIYIWSTPDKFDFIQTELSGRILEFSELIKELVSLNYLYRVSDLSADKEFSIGTKSEKSGLIGMPLSDNLLFMDLELLFSKNIYFVTEKLYLLPKYDYKQPEEYNTDLSLIYMRKSVRWAAVAAIVSAISTIVTVVSIILLRC